MKNTLIIAAVLAIVGISWYAGHSTVQKPVGAVASPDVMSPYLRWGNVVDVRSSMTFRTSSTTVCSLQSPTSTSTLQYAAAMITTATTSALYLEWGKATVPDATTTSLGGTALAARAQAVVVASSTVGAFTGGTAIIDPQFVFAPNTYLNFKYGGSVCTDGSACTTMAGNCTANWIVN